MTYSVGPKGQVVLPKHIRQRLGISPGDRVTVEESDGVIHVRKAAPAGALLGLLADAPHSLTGVLENARRAERAREDTLPGAGRTPSSR